MKVYDVVAHRTKTVKKSDVIGIVRESWNPGRVRLIVKAGPRDKILYEYEGRTYKDTVVVSNKTFVSMRIDMSNMELVEFEVPKLTEAEIETL